ncbi:hypothetical protein L484_016403 [Morus notabilis]|uniref:Uncharacterized protein n=1 Tax=Morus notabilis TaxID=981085 RepID=W9RN04_9ROSA|nr:hypothetical protein L484_016403 [Morus notabilis]
MNCNETIVENVSTSSCRDGVETTVLISESRLLESGPGVHEEAGSSDNVNQLNSAIELEEDQRSVPSKTSATSAPSRATSTMLIGIILTIDPPQPREPRRCF